MITENLTAGWNFTEGVLRDVSGNGNHGTMAGDFFTRGANGNAATGANGGRAVIPNDASLATDAITIAMSAADFSKGFPVSSVIIDKRTGGGIDWLYYPASANILGFYNGSVSSYLAMTPADLKRAKTIIVRKAAGSAKPEFFIDGVYFGTCNANITLAGNAQAMTLLSVYTGANPYSGKIDSLWIYSDEKTPEEIAEIHEDLITLSTPQIGRRNFYTGPSASPNDPYAAGAWNMQIDEGEIKDQIGANHGTPSAGITHVKTPWGETALHNADDPGQIDCGAANDLEFQTESFGWLGWCQFDEIGTNPFVVSHGQLNSGGHELFLLSSKPFFRTNQLGASQSVTTNTVVSTGRAYLLGFHSEVGGNNIVSLNGIDDTSATVARVNPASTSRGLYFMNFFSPVAAAKGWLCKPEYFQCTAAQFQEIAAKEYKRVANKVIYNQDIQKARRRTTYTTSGEVPGTDVRYEAGGGLRIAQTEGENEKWIEGNNFGSFGSIPHSGHPLGTYTWDMITTATQRCYFLPMSDGTTATSGTRLSVDATVGAVGKVELLDNASNLMTSADGYTTPGQKHSFKLVLKDPGLYTNNCFLYMDDVLIPAATGSNPSRYVPTAGSIKNMLVGPYGLGKVGNIKQYFGDITS